MNYKYSNIDDSNIKWFTNDKTRNTLVEISISGKIRGLSNTSMQMQYPISAIAGKNGCGKSTLLALAACAFHNETDYTPPSLVKKYYTFGDFFTFTVNEEGISGVLIRYTINTDQEKKHDIRKKKPSGKWNDFNTRFRRKVAFLGINRILPPSESKVHKNYKRTFVKEIIEEGVENEIIVHLTHIFSQNYEHMALLVHNAHRLFQVERNHISYTGFNMGAGENAVIQLLIELYAIGVGGLLVVDEIELGLHVSAQVALINELKIICEKRKCQIICSTHSEHILEALPPEGRFLIETKRGLTHIESNISPEFAFGKMAEVKTKEIDILVEDDVGAAVIKTYLPTDLRERVELHIIGSDNAVARQLASNYRIDKTNCIAFIDGDKRTKNLQHIKIAENELETHYDDEFPNWIKQALNYLPGNTWPERYILETVMKNESAVSELADRFESTKEDIDELLEKAIAAGKHNEFYTIAKSINLEIDNVRREIIVCEAKTAPEDKQSTVEIIRNALKNI